MNKGLQGNPGETPGPMPGMARAWVKFKYTAANGVQLLAHYNVAAVVRNGAGDYTVTFQRPFTTPHYALSISAGTSGGTNCVAFVHASDTSLSGSKRIATANPNVAFLDPNEVYLIAWGEQ